jgi:hypothetical protein
MSDGAPKSFQVCNAGCATPIPHSAFEDTHSIYWIIVAQFDEDEDHQRPNLTLEFDRRFVVASR